MLPPSLNRPPVTPALQGTQIRSGGLSYTAGADYVADVITDLLGTQRPLAMDIESEGLHELSYRLKCVTVASANHCVLLDPRDPFQYAQILRVTQDAPALIFHNSAFDVPILGVLGLISLRDVNKVWDTLIYARLAESDPYIPKTLEGCAQRYLDLTPTYSISKAFRSLGLTNSQGFKTVDINAPTYLYGAMADAITTAQLFPIIRDAAYTRITRHPFNNRGVIGEDALILINREQMTNRIFLRRSIKGLNIDLDFCDRFAIKNTENIDKLEKKLLDEGLKPGHGAALVSKLDDLGILPEEYPRTAKTNAPSATKTNLESLSHPLVATHISYKELVKVRDDYLVKVRNSSQLDGKIHPTVGILSASATGRMSLADPPLQQFPKDARGVVLADEGRTFTSIDWSQIEPVVLLNISHDTDALHSYEDGTGDLYTAISEFTGVARKQAKIILLGQMYGQGIKKLSASLGISLDEGKRTRDQVFSPIPKAGAFMRRVKKVADEYGLMITVSGRVLSIPKSDEGGYSGYKAINYLCQGSAYDVLAESLINIEKAGLGDAVYLALHDELIIDSEAASDVRQIMEQPPPRLCTWSGRTPVLRTDSEDLGNRWKSV